MVISPLALCAATSTSVFVKPSTQTKEEVVRAFKYYENLNSNGINNPTVVQVSLNHLSFSIPVFAVYNISTSEFEPYSYSVDRVETKSTVQAVGANSSPAAVNDGDYSSYVEFPLTGDAANKGELTFTFEKPITASSLDFTLDNNVALPQKISIKAVVAGKDYVVLAPTQPTGGNIVFPQTTSSIWHVMFDYVQPLRISEMKFNDLSAGQTGGSHLRFLAQPGGIYDLYFDADRYVSISTQEAGDLSSNAGVQNVTSHYGVMKNPIYRPVDSDGDSVPDLSDNCISVANSDQNDSDHNGRGDSCEDYDRDGILAARDNCPDMPNVSQEDTDGDSVGDVCDSFENRVTERSPWLPWLGIGIAGVVVLGLFVVVFKHKESL